MGRIDPNAPPDVRRRALELRTVTRDLLFATVDSIGERRNMLDISTFVGRLAGTDRDTASTMWVWAISDRDVEIDRDQKHLRLNKNDENVRAAVDLDPIPLAYGRTIVRAALDLLVDDQLAIDEQQRALNEKLDAYHPETN